MSGPYDNMIDMPHPTSAKYPRMSAIDRAAQFSPFAALSGHDAAIRETARLTDRRMELDENVKAEMDLRLRGIMELPMESREVTITYFQMDERKAGGAYVDVAGHIKRIDDVTRTVIMTRGQQILIDDIYQIESNHK